jgi:hypothetical protein
MQTFAFISTTFNPLQLYKKYKATFDHFSLIKKKHLKKTGQMPQK